MCRAPWALQPRVCKGRAWPAPLSTSCCERSRPPVWCARDGRRHIAPEVDREPLPTRDGVHQLRAVRQHHPQELRLPDRLPQRLPRRLCTFNTLSSFLPNLATGNLRSACCDACSRFQHTGSGTRRTLYAATIYRASRVAASAGIRCGCRCPFLIRLLVLIETGCTVVCRKP